jgi:hypothetical protein
VVRKLDDGSNFNALPVLEEAASGGSMVGDSFDIANYVEKTFPGSGAGSLVPTNSTRTGLDYASPTQNLTLYTPLTVRLDANNQSKPTLVSMFRSVPMFRSTYPLTWPSFRRLCQCMPFDPETVDDVKTLFARGRSVSRLESRCGAIQ